MAQTRVDRLAGAAVSGTGLRIALVIGFAALTAAGAYVVVPVPGSPVPVTLQTLMVTLSGLLLGPALGAAAQATYLAAGAAGAPVFMGGMAGLPHLLGPTGGYLIAFPLAAWVAGWLAGPARRGAAPAGAGEHVRVHLRFALAALVASLVIFAGGAAQLSLLTGDVERAVRLGVVPFLIGDALKIAVAALLAGRLARKLSALM
jgi:biotin transport system substrate-specific component